MNDRRQFAIALAAAVSVSVLSQVLRLQRSEAAASLACDYAGRLAALLALLLVGTTRRVAFATERLRIGLTEAGLWTVTLALFQLWAALPVERLLNDAVPVKLGSHAVPYREPLSGRHDVRLGPSRHPRGNSLPPMHAPFARCNIRGWRSDDHRGSGLSARSSSASGR